MSAKLPDPYVRFYIQNGVEVATMLAADFRSAMLERDHEIERLRKIERAARAAVETEKALGYVSLTLLSDVLDESSPT